MLETVATEIGIAMLLAIAIIMIVLVVGLAIQFTSNLSRNMSTNNRAVSDNLDLQGKGQ